MRHHFATQSCYFNNFAPLEKSTILNFDSENKIHQILVQLTTHGYLPAQDVYVVAVSSAPGSVPSLIALTEHSTLVNGLLSQISGTS